MYCKFIVVYCVYLHLQLFFCWKDKFENLMTNKSDIFNAFATCENSMQLPAAIFAVSAFMTLLL